MVELKQEMKLYRQMNSYHYSKMIKRARTIIERALSQSARPAIALSGGKDSVAMAGIVCQFCKPLVIWNDSGLEMPESKTIVYAVAEMFGLEVIVAKGCAMEEAEKVAKGELSKTSTKVMQSLDTIVGPVKKSLADNYVDLEFVGLRKGESLTRKMLLCKYGPIHESKRWGIVIAWPMMDWDGADCLAYITEHDLPLHPAYLRDDNPADVRVSWAFDKTRQQPAETEHLKRTYPQIYRKLREIGLCQ